MADHPQNLDEAIDAVEEAYEFMLAYAAQGRRNGDDDTGTGIRERLQRSEFSLGLIIKEIAAGSSARASAGAEGSEFLDIVTNDAARARAAIRFVLAQKGLGSQIIDNLNANSHVRALLTDLFLLDEALKISGL